MNKNISRVEGPLATTLFGIFMIVTAYVGLTVLHFHSISKSKIVVARNFANALALYIIEQQGGAVEVLSETPGHFYATDEDGRPK